MALNNTEHYMKGGDSMDNQDKYKEVCMVARPCLCNAPIAYSGVNYDGDVRTTLYSIDDYMETKEVYREEYEYLVDIGLRCTRCGKDWTPFDPLF